MYQGLHDKRNFIISGAKEDNFLSMLNSAKFGILLLDLDIKVHFYSIHFFTFAL